MQQKTQKQYLIYGGLLSFAPIFIQVVGLDSKFSTDSITDSIGFDIFGALAIIATVILALFGGKFLMKAITFRWNNADVLNPYREVYKMLIAIGIATLVTIISLAIRFSRL